MACLNQGLSESEFFDYDSTPTPKYLTPAAMDPDLVFAKKSNRLGLGLTPVEKL